MTIPAGRAASRAWKTLPNEVRTQAMSLARAGQPHPDPEIRHIIVGHVLRLATMRRRLIALLLPMIVLVSSTNWLPEVPDLRLDVALHLGILIAAIAGFGVIAGILLRQSRLLNVGPPNINAIALATPAPAEPVKLRRPADSLILGAIMLAGPLVIALPTVLIAVEDYAMSSGTTDRVLTVVFAAGFGSLLAAWLVFVIGLMVIGAGPAGRLDLGTLSAEGIHIRDLKLTVPWQDIRKVNGGEDGVAGLAIWLSDPAKTLATGHLEPWRRKLLLRGARVTGWLNLPADPLLAPSTLTVVTAIALHRAYLAEVAA